MSMRPTDAPSANPDYRKAERVYRKAYEVLESAKNHIARADTSDDYNAEMADWAAIQLLEAACKRLNAAKTASDKAFGVGVYQPYGGRGRRR